MRSAPRRIGGGGTPAMEECRRLMRCRTKRTVETEAVAAAERA